MSALPMILAKNIGVVIVAYRNPRDVVECLEALRNSESEPAFDIYICENGGADAFDALVAALVGAGGPCHDVRAPGLPLSEIGSFVRVRDMQLRGRRTRVLVAEASENLGYAGAINAWIRVLVADPEWPGVWILNPDTQPDSRALAELVSWSKLRERGMVGSRIVPIGRADLVRTRGLRWRRMLASTEAVDYLVPAAVEPDPDVLEDRLDAPTGASLYVTRACLDRLGLMDERYFLYFEDLDWGRRAKVCCGIGYAHKSLVPHIGGTTIGAVSRGAQSQLSVYLESRNRIHFVRTHHPGWLPWTVLVLLVSALAFGVRGSLGNMRVGLLGVVRGIAGETGRPDAIVNAHGRSSTKRDVRSG